ncbi:MAG: hypothetical protein F3741_03485 [Nitrospinae bacterium]|nr:hypothetical protein [Nitrospinota bacterium]
MDKLTNVLDVTNSKQTDITKLSVETTGIKSKNLQSLEENKAEVREMGAKRYPFKLEGIGSKPINTEDSVNIVVPPEIGKGSLIKNMV